jgi:hypothetical protein
LIQDKLTHLLSFLDKLLVANRRNLCQNKM